jgi:2-iminobutanoate/2-iminopropanoate deaminase
VRPVSTGDAPTPAGHYAQGVVHGGLVFVSGQLPVDTSGAVVGADDIEAQTRQTLRNVEAILRAGGSGLDRLLAVTIYITGRRYWADVNRVYAEVLGEHRPARAVIPVPEIKPGCLIEIQAVATTGES